MNCRGTKDLSQIGALTRLFQEKAIGAADCAHLGVDIQECYNADPAATSRIVQEIAPLFRHWNIPNYWIHFSLGNVDEDGLPLDRYAFPKNLLRNGEKVIEKNYLSAITSSNIDQELQKAQKKLIALSGFNFLCCIKETALDAKAKGYDVVLFTDGTDYLAASATERMLREKGVIFESSKNFFAALQALRPPAPSRSAPNIQSPALAPYGR